MKILLINNYHYIKGGSERAYFELGKLLENNGHSVAYFSTLNNKNKETKWSKYFIKDYDFNKENNIFQKIKIAFRIIYNIKARRNLRKLIKDFQPDVAHLHNIYHHLSPSIIHELKKNKIKTIMHLHDYKLICPNYKLFNQNKICEKCKGGKYYNCFKNKCIKNSRVKSFVIMFESYLHNKILKTYDYIETYIAPSNFLKNKFIEFGFPNKKIRVIYNFVNKMSDKKSNLKDYFLYFGRISKEKGIDILLNAFDKLPDKKLIIAGEGELSEKQEVRSSNKKSNIEYVGFKKGIELENLILEAKAILLPSIWYENMPYSMLEAMNIRKVVVASDIGGITDVIKDEYNGILFTKGDSDDLVEKIKKIDSKNLKEISKNAKNTIINRFYKDNYYKKIFNIYNELDA